jgi:hypothetical protein
MDTECSDVRSSFAAHPENSQMSVIVKLVELAFMDGSDTELSFDGGDQWRSLEQSTRQRLKSSSELRFTSRELVV